MPSENALEPWYGGKPGTIMFYRINRRPLPEPTLFDDQPDDVLDHLTEVLLFGEPVVTGRRYQREWLLGARSIDTKEPPGSGVTAGTDVTGLGRFGVHSAVSG